MPMYTIPDYALVWTRFAHGEWGRRPGKKLAVKRPCQEGLWGRERVGHRAGKGLKASPAPWSPSLSCR